MTTDVPLCFKPDPKTMMVKAADIKAAMTKNTVAVVGSAPQFPNGVIDPIDTRHVLGLALSAAMNAPVQHGRHGIFRM